jgi:hypothetical protein
MRKQLMAALLLTVSGSALASPFGLAEVFTAPTTDSFLESVNAGGLSGITAGANYTFDLFPYLNGTVGPALFQQSATGLVGPLLTVDLNVQLAPGQMYAFALLAVDGGSVSTLDGAGTASEFLASCTVTSCSPVVGSFGPFAVFGFDTRYSVAPVPEPATLVMMGIGLLGVGLTRRKRES